MISRTFLSFAMSLAAGVAVSGNPFRAAAADAGNQYYELRVYTTTSDAQRQRVNDYWQNAAIPAYNRMGIQPVGVFTEQEDSATKPTPAYDRFESSLLVAFDGMKHISIPAADKKPNVFEMRTYKSSSEGKGLNKIQMFESGEITVMKEVGLAPIFYGRKVVGSHMPCLVYMTCGVNADEHKKHWSAFGAAPVWKQLQADPQYKDNMIGMIRVILKRTAASQI